MKVFLQSIEDDRGVMAIIARGGSILLVARGGGLAVSDPAGGADGALALIERRGARLFATPLCSAFDHGAGAGRARLRSGDLVRIGVTPFRCEISSRRAQRWRRCALLALALVALAVLSVHLFFPKGSAMRVSLPPSITTADARGIDAASPLSVDDLLAEGASHLKAGREAQARLTLFEAAMRAPDDRRIERMRASMDGASRSSRRDAEPALERAAECYARGRAQMEAGELVAARTSFERAQAEEETAGVASAFSSELRRAREKVEEALRERVQRLLASIEDRMTRADGRDAVEALSMLVQAEHETRVAVKMLPEDESVRALFQRVRRAVDANAQRALSAAAMAERMSARARCRVIAHAIVAALEVTRPHVAERARRQEARCAPGS